jgi:LPXTG-motif cell wall-anchored protein
MTKRSRWFTVGVLAAGTALAFGSPVSAAEGSFSPIQLAPGDTFAVSFSNTPVVDGDGDDQCDDVGPDEFVEGVGGTYSNRPMWVGFLPGDLTTTNPDDIDLYADDVVSVTIGTLPTYTHPTDDTYGWAGQFTGSGTLPDLAAGTYTVALQCGQPDSTDPDSNGTPVLTLITVTGETAPPTVDPAIELALELILNQSITDGSLGVPVAGSGLLPGADYEVVLRSDPVVIGTGIVDKDGSFSATYPIPANTPDGGHSVTVTSLDANGNPVSAVGYFNLEGGVVVGVSFTNPFPTTPVLPETGSDVLALVIAAVGLLLLGGVLVQRRTA